MCVNWLGADLNLVAFVLDGNCVEVDLVRVRIDSLFALARRKHCLRDAIPQWYSLRATFFTMGMAVLTTKQRVEEAKRKQGSHMARNR